MTDRRHRDAYLMGAAGLELASDQACRAEAFLEPPVGGGVPTALFSHDGHFLAMARIASNGPLDLACMNVEPAPNERQIFAFERAGAAVVGEEVGEALMRGVGFGDDEEPGRVLVEPVHDTGPLDPADARQARSAMADQRVDQRARRVARRRMDDEPGRLVDHDQMIVLVDHGKFDVLAQKGRVLRHGRLEDDARARSEARRRIARNLFVDSHLARLDQRLEPGARERNASCRRRLAQEPVEPLAGVLIADVENLQSLRRDKRRASRRINRNVVRFGLIGLGRMTPGALLRLCVHVRSRRRGRAAAPSAAGGATRGPSAATIASTSGRARALWASSPRRMAATWAGLLPQQPPMMGAPQSTASPAYFSISSGVPE